jgi:hypothetical protein
VALRFKLDENVPGEVSALLRDAGHDASSALGRDSAACRMSACCEHAKKKRAF